MINIHYTLTTTYYTDEKGEEPLILEKTFAHKKDAQNELIEQVTAEMTTGRCGLLLEDAAATWIGQEQKYLNVRTITPIIIK